MFEIFLSNATFLVVLLAAHKLGARGIAFGKLEDLPLYQWLENGVKDL